MNLAHKTMVVILALLAPSAAAAQGAGAAAQPPSVGFSFDLTIHPLLECHFYLKTFGHDSIRPDSSSGIDIGSEATIYNTAQRTIQDPEVWRWFETQIVEGPDVAAVKKAAQALPATFDTERNRVGVKMLVDSLESAFPKFEKAIWPAHLREVNRALVGAKKRLQGSQQRIAQVLMEKMAFLPIDSPATTYVVLRSGGVTSWGKTSHGYFTVVGMQGLSPLVLVESALHESTHVLDTLQPFTSKSVLKRVREGLRGENPAQIDIFIHGLIAYNAGALVKRFLAPAHSPAGIMAPAHVEDYRPYRSTYEVIWNEYLDGKRTTDDVVAKLIEEFKAVKRLMPGAVGASQD